MLQFVIHFIFVSGALSFAFFMRKKELSLTNKIIYYTLALICVLIIAMKGIFSLNPALEASLMPVAFYSRIDRTYSFVIFIIFLAIISILATPKERKAIYPLLILFSIYVIYLPSWRLSTPACYKNEGKFKNGVCLQSTTYTCGASAIVSFLSKYGIKATEGEMARLTETIPYKGVSNFQAVAGLNRKLEALNSDFTGELKVYRDEELDQMKTPCITSIKYSIFFDHMICIKRIDGDYVYIADPLKGNTKMERDEFLQQWRNVNIELHKK